ncbi:MAG: vanadium-dependent haloperoxidase [Chloroflexota bacterium]
MADPGRPEADHALAGRSQPFLIESADQFRPGPPPDLASAEWATDLNEVMELGGAESTSRTPEQALIAQFWATQPVVQIYEGYQQAVVDHGLDALQAARLLALTGLVAADAITACFDAKYHYLFWRPFTAIPGADADGNDATVADPAWKPLIGTPRTRSTHPPTAA